MERRTRRRPVVQTHRAARLISTHRRSEADPIEAEIAEEEKKSYMDFIYRLMGRMDMESLERMLEAAIDEIK